MIKKRLKSKTYWLQVVALGIGIAFANFDEVRVFFGEYAGIAFIVLSILNAAVRELTTKPLSEK